MKSSDQFRSIN